MLSVDPSTEAFVEHYLSEHFHFAQNIMVFCSKDYDTSLASALLASVKLRLGGSVATCQNMMDKLFLKGSTTT